MATGAKSEVFDLKVRRLAVMLGRTQVMGDIECISTLDPVSVDVEAGEYESDEHALHARWELYIGVARDAMAILNAPASTAEQRAQHIWTMEQELRADAERERQKGPE